MMNVKTDEVEPGQDFSKQLCAKELEIKIITDGETEDLVRELADSHYREGNYLRALLSYTKVLSYDPSNARIWNKIAVIFLKLGEPSSAISLSHVAHRLINKEIGK